MQYAHLVGQAAPLLENLGYKPDYWKMGTKYDSSSLSKSDIAVFILNDFNWGIEINDMTKGIRTELELCIKSNIPIYIAYKRRRDDAIGFYKALVENEELHGIVGTTLPIFNRLKWGPEDYIEIDYLLEENPCTQKEALNKVKLYNKRRKHK